MKSHKHAEFIKAKADGQEVQELVAGNVLWMDMEDDYWGFIDRYQYRIKPAEPKWPETMMSNEQLQNAEELFSGYKESLRNIANSAIANACESGAVVTTEAADKIRQEAYSDGQASAFKHEEAAREDRDMKVARSVLRACNGITEGKFLAIVCMELSKIIATVK